MIKLGTNYNHYTNHSISYFALHIELNNLTLMALKRACVLL